MRNSTERLALELVDVAPGAGVGGVTVATSAGVSADPRAGVVATRHGGRERRAVSARRERPDFRQAGVEHRERAVV